MNGRRFDILNPAGQLSRSELERLTEHAERLDQMSVGGACSYLDTGAGRVVIPSVQRAAETSLQFSGARVSIQGTIPLPGFTPVTLSWARVEADYDDYHDPASPQFLNLPFSATSPGLWFMSGVDLIFTWDGPSFGTNNVRLSVLLQSQRRGRVVGAVEVSPGLGGAIAPGLSLTATGIVGGPDNTTDRISVVAQQSGIGPLNPRISGYFWVYHIASPLPSGIRAGTS